MNTRKALLTLAAAALTGLNAYATDIVVKPGAYTIEKALQQAREARRLDKATDICLRLEAGTYNLNQPIIIRPEDNGTRIVADGKAVISGGVKISGWKKEGKYYVASVPDFNGRPLEFRQMWVNGKKAVRARDVEDFEDMFRIRNIDKAKETLYVPAEAVKRIMNAQYAEMVLHEMWCVANLRIKDIKIQLSVVQILVDLFRLHIFQDLFHLKIYFLLYILYLLHHSLQENPIILMDTLYTLYIVKLINYYTRCYLLYYDIFLPAYMLPLKNLYIFHFSYYYQGLFLQTILREFFHYTLLYQCQNHY